MSSIPVTTAAWRKLVRTWRYAMAIRALYRAQKNFEKLDEPQLVNVTAQVAALAYHNMTEGQ